MKKRMIEGESVKMVWSEAEGADSHETTIGSWFGRVVGLVTFDKQSPL
jgi:hypothetical protein